MISKSSLMMKSEARRTSAIIEQIFMDSTADSILLSPFNRNELFCQVRERPFTGAIRAQIFVQVMMVWRSIETQSMNKPSASLGPLALSFSSSPPPPDKIGYEIS